MLSRIHLVALAILVAAGSTSWGQITPPTTVQLPTFNFTTVNTTVMVPDGGSVTLGGIDRIAEGSVERGTPLFGKIPFVNRLFKNKGIGRNVSSSRIRAEAKIIIFDELEDELMNQASQARAARGDRRTFDEMVNDFQAKERLRKQQWEKRTYEYLSRNVDRRPARSPLQLREEKAQPATKPLPDVEEIRRQTERAKEQRDAEAVAYFEEGKAAEEAGKKGAARVYYKMASRRANGKFQQEIDARLEYLTN